MFDWDRGVGTAEMADVDAIDPQLRRRPVEGCAKVLWIGLPGSPLAQPNFVVGKDERDIPAFLNSCNRNAGGKGEGDRFTVHVSVQLRN